MSLDMTLLVIACDMPVICAPLTVEVHVKTFSLDSVSGALSEGVILFLVIVVKICKVWTQQVINLISPLGPPPCCIHKHNVLSMVIVL